MRVLIAPNAFKESLSALEATDILTDSILSTCPDAEIETVPLADGGDGTLDVVTRHWQGVTQTLVTEDPLRRRIVAPIGLDKSGEWAVIEMARTSGLALLAPDERNPFITTTFGLGLLIGQAAGLGVRKILLCIGGSATVDGGVGMAEALGFRHLDRDGNAVPSCGGYLREIAHIQVPDAESVVGKLEVTVLSDVTNPLCGQYGAARIFGPQKGATPEQVEMLEAGLRNLAGVWERHLGKRLAEEPGAGAAGGVGGGAMAYLNARLMSGGEWILDLVGLEERITRSDLVITGEGGLDLTSLSGKVPGRVAALSRKHGVPCLGVCGVVDPDAETALKEAGFTQVIPLAPPVVLQAESIRRAAEYLRRRGEWIGERIRDHSGDVSGWKI
jgi:glycerate kinase